MKTPKFLKHGDRIAIISPAGYINPDFIEGARQLLISKGYEPVLFPSCLNRHFQMAGTDEERLSDLQKALDSNEVDAILCSRGGYAVNHIIDKIDLTKFKENPKWIMGYSDITNLHLLANKHGVQSMHCQMAKPMTEDGNSESVLKIFDILSGNIPEYKIESHVFNRQGCVEGELIGGNMSIIYSLQGTDYAIDCENKILFIEDLNEYLYHLDRMLINLKLSGKLAKIKGLIVGTFSDMKDNNSPFGKTAYEIVKAHTEEYNYPICFGFPCGHTGINIPLIEGCKCKLSVTKDFCTIKQMV